MRPSKWYDEARWIWLPGYDDTSPEGKIVLFRRQIDIKELPTLPVVFRVSADTRYRFYVNGTSVSIGPCKSYPDRWYFEEVDVRPFLTVGHNVLSAKVLRFSDKHPGSMSLMRTANPGLIVHGEINGQKLHTGCDWQTRLDISTMMESRKKWNHALGPPFLVLNETVDANELEEDWHTAPSPEWSSAVVVSPKAMMLPVLDNWKLHERPIPLMEQTETRLVRAVRCSDASALDSWTRFAALDAAFEVPPQSTVWVEFEAAEYTTAHISLQCNAPAGAAIRLLYSECYESPMPRSGPGVQRIKGDRTDHTTGKLYGSQDTYTARPGLNTYTPFWFRAFRYIRLDITVPADSPPLILTSLTLHTTRYPLHILSTISTPSNPTLSHLWRTSLATLRACMHETYEDCPFYEQNQFLMDSRLQMLFTYAVSGDDRLARKTMREFRASRLDTGLLRAHFPSPGRAVNIPAFSLFFVAMVHDHYVWFGDGEVVRAYLGTVDGVVEYYQGLVDGRGLVGRFEEDEDWAFVDWVREWQRPGGLYGMGMPPSYLEGEDGVATVHSLIYVWALELAAELCHVAGRIDTGNEYLQRAEGILEAVRARCWDGAFFTDGLHNPTELASASNAHSQHTQVWAILAGAVQSHEATDLLRRTMAVQEMPRCSYAMRFYVFRAAAQTGLYEELWAQLIQPWKDMLAQNLLTFAEDDIGMRSDCHGWSAVPLWEIATEIFGVRPGNWARSSEVKPKVGILGSGKNAGEFVVGDGGMKMRVDVEEGRVSVSSVHVKEEESSQDRAGSTQL